jgi:hypothetical protein
VIVAATGGDSKLDVPQPSKQLQPARGGAPVDQQLDRLEEIVRAARRSG